MRVLCNFFIFFFVINFVVWADDSNLDIIDQLLTSFVKNELAGFRLDSDTVAIRSDLENDDIENYIRYRLADLLHADSIVVYRNYIQPTAFDGLLIDIRVCKPEILYSYPFNQTPLHEAQERREIRLSLSGQIVRKPNELMVDTFDTTITFVDTVMVSDLTRREKSAYGFTRGKRIKLSTWDVFFEPALVISTAAVVVYLFFNQRF